MKQINLYQAAFHPPRVVMPARRLLAGGVVFLCGLLALYAWDAWRLALLRQEVGELTARAAKLEARVNAGNVVLQADPAVLAEAESVETRLRNLQQAQTVLASGVLGAERGYSERFRALARARADGAWLTHIEINDRGQTMNLRGRTLGGENSARLIASLRGEPLFVGLSFSGLTLEPPQDTTREAVTPADAGPPPAPRFLEFTLSAQSTAPSAMPNTASQPNPAALAAALAARGVDGKLDMNQAMQAAAAAARKTP
jgi:hypothetical protein